MAHITRAYFGSDVRPLPGIDLQWNLEVTPLPLPDGCREEIGSSHLLEHIRNLIPLMNEGHRLLQPVGIFRAVSPQVCDSQGPGFASAFQDPSHVRFFLHGPWRCRERSAA